MLLITRPGINAEKEFGFQLAVESKSQIAITSLALEAYTR